MVAESHGQVEPTAEDIEGFLTKLVAWGGTLAPSEQAAGQQLIAALSRNAATGAEVSGYQMDVVVGRGDTLWGIAQQVYGDGRMWPLIWAANQDRIGNPNLIFPGQIFRLPGT